MVVSASSLDLNYWHGIFHDNWLLPGGGSGQRIDFRGESRSWLAVSIHRPLIIVQVVFAELGDSRSLSSNGKRCVFKAAAYLCQSKHADVS